MSNSGEPKTKWGGAAAPPPLRRHLFAALTVAFALELAGRLVNRYSDAQFAGEILSTTALLITITAIAILVVRQRGGWIARGAMSVATLSLCLALGIRVVGTIPGLEDLPIAGMNSSFRGVVLSVTDLVGITAWLFGFFDLVFALEYTRICLDGERAKLEREIEERHKAEAVLRESEVRFRAVFDHAAACILVMTPRGRLLECNRALAVELGYSVAQLRDTDLDLLSPPEDRARVREALAALDQAESGDAHPFTVGLTSSDERVIEYDVHPTLFRADNKQPGIVVAVLENLTARAHRERQIQERQKAESLEILAGGMAHDFNNLLVGMLTNADFLHSLAAPGTREHETSADMVASARRAAELCQLLLAYAGKAPRREQILDLSELVENSRQLIAMALAPEARLRIDTADDPLPVSADPAQLQQVLVSLISNASDALRGAAGDVRVATSPVELAAADFTRFIQPITATPGPHVMLEVADNGCGLSAETTARIFEPFYSTKHDGSGLGLPAVLGIVQAHRGALELLSAPENGTTVRIYLPAAPSVPTPEAGPAPSQVNETPAGASQIILIVDDEAFVRNAARRVLEHHGYTVIEAEDGEEGVEQFRAHHESLSAVLLDLTMPRMTGDRACGLMRGIDSRVPIILCSGYSEREGADAENLQDIAAYIQKPYRLQQLIEVLRRVTGNSQP